MTTTGEDRREYVVAGWCVHPDFIPMEKVIVVPEPELSFVVGLLSWITGTIHFLVIIWIVNVPVHAFLLATTLCYYKITNS